MRTAGFILVVILLAVSAWLAIHDNDQPPSPPAVPVHVVDPRGDVAWTPTVPPTTTSSTTTTAPRRSQVRLIPSAQPGDIWWQLAHCETGGTMNPRAYNPAGPYYGFLQFDEPTWHTMGGTGLPWDHPYNVQVALGKKLHALRGWKPWPRCARELGLLSSGA